MNIKTAACGAIRKSTEDGHEWLDTGTLSHSREHSAELAAATDRNCGPMWAKDSPVVRVVLLRIEEIA